MQEVTQRALLSGLVFAVTWAMLALVMGGTWISLLIGALAGMSFGVAMYWFGRRFQQPVNDTRPSRTGQGNHRNLP